MKKGRSVAAESKYKTANCCDDHSEPFAELSAGSTFEH